MWCEWKEDKQLKGDTKRCFDKKKKNAINATQEKSQESNYKIIGNKILINGGLRGETHIGLESMCLTFQIRLYKNKQTKNVVVLTEVQPKLRNKTGNTRVQIHLERPSRQCCCQWPTNSHPSNCGSNQDRHRDKSPAHPFTVRLSVHLVTAWETCDAAVR